MLIKHMNLGPTSKPTFYGGPALQFMKDSTKYLLGLPKKDQFVVWRYTAGSASVNSMLIFGNYESPIQANVIHWVRLTLQYYANTFKTSPIETLNNILKSGDQNRLASYINTFIKRYTNNLTRIIRNAPRPTQGIIVYKISGSYPGLPNSSDELPTSVEQLPFNSTSLDSDFNYQIFSAPENTCCMYKLEISSDTECMYIPFELHAYGQYEREIIINKGSFFNITNIGKTLLQTVDPSKINIETVQDKKKIQMGPVYQISSYQPCGDISCQVVPKIFTLYTGNISS